MLFVFFLWGLGLALPAAAQAQCSSNADCGAGEACVYDANVSAYSCLPSCTLSSECSSPACCQVGISDIEANIVSVCLEPASEYDSLFCEGDKCTINEQWALACLPGPLPDISTFRVDDSSNPPQGFTILVLGNCDPGIQSCTDDSPPTPGCSSCQASAFNFEGDSVPECYDGVDNDLDGKFDCAEPECANASSAHFLTVGQNFCQNCPQSACEGKTVGDACNGGLLWGSTTLDLIDGVCTKADGSTSGGNCGSGGSNACLCIPQTDDCPCFDTATLQGLQDRLSAFIAAYNANNDPDISLAQYLAFLNTSGTLLDEIGGGGLSLFPIPGCDDNADPNCVDTMDCNGFDPDPDLCQSSLDWRLSAARFPVPGFGNAACAGKTPSGFLSGGSLIGDVFHTDEFNDVDGYHLESQTVFLVSRQSCGQVIHNGNAWDHGVVTGSIAFLDNNNEVQEDACDAIREACRTDSDGDNIIDCLDDCNHNEVCGLTENLATCPDDCTVTDSDGDGFPDDASKCYNCIQDNCVHTSNPDQADADQDGIGDVCDSTPHVDGCECLMPPQTQVQGKPNHSRYVICVVQYLNTQGMQNSGDIKSSAAQSECLGN